ncbi:uncharacterized protein [Nicotiana sylvestris]|uniref:uncharacterized protein n=1 Tax=Nicotiana sylvestris TaxID=4096 RepID=UPI00388CCEBC
MFFDGAVNAKDVGIRPILISSTGKNYPTITQLRFLCTDNTSDNEAYIMGMNMAVDQDVEELLIMGDSDLIIRQAQEDLSKQFKSVEFRYNPQFHNELADALATLASMLPYPVEMEPYLQPWYHDLKRFLKTKEYPEQASRDQKRTIRRLASSFFLSGEVLYRRIPDLNLLRCVDAQEIGRIMNEIHARVHGDLIHAPPSELHPMSALWPFVAWGMDVIGIIEPKASNGHRFILVAIDYFTKWVEAITLKAVTKKAVVDFMHSNIICHFGIPKTTITDNAANLNSHLMREIMAEKFPFALLGYRTTVHISVRATPYLLVYGTEAVIPAEVEIPSLRIIVEAEIEDNEWVKTRLE